MYDGTQLGQEAEVVVVVVDVGVVVLEVVEVVEVVDVVVVVGVKQPHSASQGVTTTHGSKTASQASKQEL